ncbi:MAG: RluA family pseudouridine synthase [Kiritimatiellae bacterium]|nr:RluA family pseudouridine synthase [Kiritimatiellia bacterium]
MRDRSDIRRKGNGTRPAGVPPARPGPERIPLDILFEDADILAVYKPAGMIVHPAPGHTSGTLVNALLAHCPSIAGVGSVERPGIVHRLDRETSGVMVVAKTGRAYRRLRQMFEAHDSIRKTYLAVLHGAPSPREGTLETLIGRRRWDAKRMAVVERNGQRAVTHWQTLSRRHSLALVEFTIDTGRMHQIRVHAAHLGHPIVGDPLYGDAAADRRLAHPPRRPLLHAVQLCLPHPITGETMTFTAEPPPDLVYAG